MKWCFFLMEIVFFSQPNFGLGPRCRASFARRLNSFRPTAQVQRYSTGVWGRPSVPRHRTSVLIKSTVPPPCSPLGAPLVKRYPENEGPSDQPICGHIYVWPMSFVPARFPNAAPTTAYRSPIALYFPNEAPTKAYGPVLNQRRGPGGWPRRGLRRFVPALFIIRSPMALYFPNAAPTMAEGPVDNQQPPTVWRPGNRGPRRMCRQPATSSNGPASTPGIPLKVDLRKRRSDGRLPSTFARLG